ncbi:MAG: CRISPR-associated helicase Cas3' [Planctomycetes bacterium]|nr:CRISPR-associated helicase Cas3' [Planctomycetota bacterium]
MPVDLQQFWGKLGPNGAWHPAVCHMIDVGQVARRLADRVLGPNFRRIMARAFGVREGDAGKWLSFLCALHDLGKVSPGFQAKCPEQFGPLAHLGFRRTTSDEGRHGRVTFEALSAILRSRGFPAGTADTLAAALGGHHGSFPLPDGGSAGCDLWETSRQEVVEALRSVFGIRWEESNPQDAIPASTAMLIAGLASVSDWLGSDTRFFPLEGGTTLDIGRYASEAEAKACQALSATGWADVIQGVSAAAFGDLFFDAGPDGTRQSWQPNEVQEVCGRIAHEEHPPFLLLVEAPTGIGKTEAALWAADIIAQETRQPGLYYALPTRATSNQMLGRLLAFLKERYPGDVVQLNLLHAAADLDKTFEELRSKAGAIAAGEVEPENIGDDKNAGAKQATVVAQEWFCGHKRGLLSQFGIGTVDQALLAALTTRHFFVRLFGLAQKTVIIDEVHAYDAYMSTLLDRLLEWLAALGTSVILLSATLPAARRRALIQAYTGRPAAESDAAYPRVVVASARSPTERAYALPLGQTRELAVVEGPNDPAAVIDLLAERLADGGCAAWLCNTVGRAQEAFRAVVGSPVAASAEVILFHARFPLEDRLARERQVLARFCKRGERPRKAIVVATQVIEQSLDLDFDFLVTDLAPIDLILQRAGRLHRHPGRDRPLRLLRPEVQWLPPALDEHGAPSFGPSAYVYDPYVLFRTWLLLRARRQISLPSETETLIEAVYGIHEEGDLEPSLRAVLAALKQESERRRQRQGSLARRFILPHVGAADKVLSQLELYPPDDDESAQRLTRLADPAVTVVCAHDTPDGPALDADGREPVVLARRPGHAHVCRLTERSVRISARFWYCHFLGQPCPPGWQQVPLLRSCRLACFRQGEIQTGGRILRLDPSLGLYESSSPEE